MTRAPLACPQCGADFNAVGPTGAVCSNGHHVPRDPSGKLLIDRTAQTDREPLGASSPPEWPTIDSAAFHGLAGELVRALDPYTEADATAVLLTFLAAFGNAAGARPHVPVGTSRHPLRIWPILVGATAKARKGSSLDPVLAVMRRADPEWASECIAHGLSSGEGVIWAVRDPIRTRERVREGGEVRYVEVESDPGVADKRLFIVEEEFSRVLRVAGRAENTLSAVLRQAWERDTLRSMTKNSPARAAGAHITVVGHCVAEEARRYLSESDIAGGLANRFLWALVRRSKFLPDGAAPPPRLLDELAAAVRAALGVARTVEAIGRAADAAEAWRAVYPSLSEGKLGLVGAIIARAEAQALRIAAVYALLDRSPVICLPHLEAALAIVDFCEASARWIFGDATGDPVADQIFAALSGGRLTRSDLYDLFGRNVSSGRLDAALRTLLERGLIRTYRDASGPGRPTIWIERTEPEGRQ